MFADGTCKFYKWRHIPLLYSIFGITADVMYKVMNGYVLYTYCAISNPIGQIPSCNQQIGVISIDW